MQRIEERHRIAAGSADLRRLQIAMVAAGLAAFALLYSTQGLLPSIGDAFGVTATGASLTVSVTTGVLAITVLPMSALAERLGRPRVMSAALATACVFVLAGAAAPSFWLLLLTRAVVGLALAGVVAVAMGHIGDEVEPSAAGRAIGVYVSGTSVGGLLGRVVPAGVDGIGGWRLSVVALAAVAAGCAATFMRLVPDGRRTIPQRPRTAAAGITVHLRDPGIVRLCAAALLLMGGFVAMYNYLTYRLVQAPFDLPKTAVGLVFLAYLAGTASSTVAARLAARTGRLRVLLASVAVAMLGLMITLPPSLTCVLIGLVLFTAGFFGAHATASGWVALRARTAKSQASALYLMAYYLGSSIGGSLIGLVWTHGGWPATVATVAGCFALAAMVAAGVERQPRTAASTA